MGWYKPGQGFTVPVNQLKSTFLYGHFTWNFSQKEWYDYNHPHRQVGHIWTWLGKSKHSQDPITVTQSAYSCPSTKPRRPNFCLPHLSTTMPSLWGAPDSHRAQTPATLWWERDEWTNRMYLGNLASFSISFIPRVSDMGIVLEMFCANRAKKTLKVHKWRSCFTETHMLWFKICTIVYPFSKSPSQLFSWSCEMWKHLAQCPDFVGNTKNKRRDASHQGGESMSTHSAGISGSLKQWRGVAGTWGGGLRGSRRAIERLITCLWYKVGGEFWLSI